jgi:tRNA1(Val) A37 N6-methylase TrmN6
MLPSHMRSSAGIELDLFLPPCDLETDALHSATALYTREAVVDTILDLARWPECGGRLLDPGAGEGAFVLAALRRLRPVRNEVTAVASRVQAWEIHPHAANAARERITGTLLAMGWDRGHADAAASAIVIEGDLLTSTYPGPFSLIAGNPPYLRFGHLPPRFKSAYTRTVPGYARGDLLHAFLDRCTAMLGPNGRLALITADRWLFNAGAEVLRERIGATLGVAAVQRLDPTSAFFRPKRRRAGSPPRVHPVLVLLTPADTATRQLGRAPIYPDAREQARPDVTVLGDVAKVKLAPWLGPHGVFTLDAAQAVGLPGTALVPCVDTDDIVGDVVRKPSRFALRTDREVEPHEAVLAHLLANHSRLPPRARRVPLWRSPEPWGELPLDYDAILVPRIARELRPVRLPARVLPINHNLTIVAPKGCDLDAIIDELRSQACQTWIQERAPRLENGYHSITTRLLRQLPMPQMNRLPLP